MLTRILFYLIFYPISVLPLFILYIIAFPFYLILAFVIRYRRKVIDANFLKSFPDLSKKEIRRLRNRYYWHLTQLGIEMLKMISMSKKNVMRRYHCSNPELVNKFFDEGKRLVLTKGEVYE